jgi:hypothetical protein
MNRPRIFTGIAASSLGVLYLITPQFAHAFITLNLFETFKAGIFNAFLYGTYAISYAFTLIASIFISIQAFILGFIMTLNMEVVDSPVVQVGFSIVLAFANILFVAAIITMAVATIIRWNTYGVRKLLMRIVIAAIGVNFSLVLAGTAIVFSDQLSKFFLSQSVVGGGDTGVFEFADRIAGAFQPQQALLIDQNNGGIDGEWSKLFKDGTSQVGQVLGLIMSVFLSLALLLQVNLFLGVLNIAFFLRYIWLALLLVMLPGVWVAWIFPFSQSYVQKWMNLFIKWTFFGPISLFFLYLGLKVADVFAESGRLAIKDTVELSKKASPGLMEAFQSVLGALIQPLMNQIVSAAVIGGCLWGGLYLAHKMGIGVAGTGVKIMESAGNSVKRQVATRSKNAGLRVWDRARTSGKDADGNSRLQQLGSRLSTLASNNRAARAVGLGAAGAAIAKTGVANRKNAEERIAGYKTDLGGLSKDALVQELHRLSSGSLAANPDREAAIMELLKDKKGLGDIKKQMDERIKTAALTRNDGSIGITENATKRAEAEKIEKEKMEKLFKRQAEAGNLKDVLEADPRLAEFAPLKKRKDAKDDTDTITKEEAVAGALGGIKPDNVINIANEVTMFGPKEDDEGGVQLGQALNTLALNNGTLKKIGDINPLTIDHIDSTLDFLSEMLEEDKRNGNDAKWEAYFKDLKLDAEGLKAHKRGTETKIKSMLDTLEKSVNFETRRELKREKAKLQQPVESRGEAKTKQDAINQLWPTT